MGQNLGASWEAYWEDYERVIVAVVSVRSPAPFSINKESHFVAISIIWSAAFGLIDLGFTCYCYQGKGVEALGHQWKGTLWMVNSVVE